MRRLLATSCMVLIMALPMACKETETSDERSAAASVDQNSGDAASGYLELTAEDIEILKSFLPPDSQELTPNQVVELLIEALNNNPELKQVVMASYKEKLGQ